MEALLRSPDPQPDRSTDPATLAGILRPAPHRLLLGVEEVHVWIAFLDRLSSRRQPFFEVLAPREMARAAKFRLAKDRDEFVLSRGLLRGLLSRYVGVSPSELNFSYNPYGKPALEIGCEGEKCSFNLSHSQGVVVYAVAKTREIGVDIECVRQDVEHQQIAARFLSPGEARAVQALPPAERKKAFLSCWTKKEAYLKAKGEGFHLDPQSFDVTSGSADLASPVLIEANPTTARCCSIAPLQAPPGYIAALAAEGGIAAVTYQHIAECGWTPAGS